MPKTSKIAHILPYFTIKHLFYNQLYIFNHLFSQNNNLQIVTLQTHAHTSNTITKFATYHQNNNNKYEE